MTTPETIAIVKSLIAAGSCCAELKAAAEKFLAAVGTAAEAAAYDALLQEAREDISSIEHAIEFFESPLAAKIFGAEKAAALAAHARDRQAKGAKWCDCPACAACAQLLGYED